jgi:hypothetical protein
VFTGRELSKFFSLLMVITAVAPMVELERNDEHKQKTDKR